MGRLPARVDWIVHDRTGTKVALRLSKASMIFQVEWAGKTYRNKDGDVLRKRILELIETSEHLVFHPVVEVEVGQSYGLLGSGRVVGVVVGLRRFYYADGDSGLLELGWENRDNKHRIKHWNLGEDFTGLPHCRLHRYSHDSDCYYLAYGEELWTGLTALLDTIEQARGKIIQLLDAGDAVPRLEAVGAELLRLLPAGGEESDDE